MTTFQLAAAGVFVVLVALVYYKDLLRFVCRTAATNAVPVAGAEVTEPSIALTIVNDLISVTELRDKLSAEGCAEGVEACTNLLRVIVEHTKKKDLSKKPTA